MLEENNKTVDDKISK